MNRQLLAVIMLLLIVSLTSLTTLSLIEGCGSVKPIVTDVTECAKAEAVAVSDGYSIVQIAAKIFAALQGGASAVLAVIEDAIKTYGADIVACVVDNYPEPAAVGPGSGSAAADTPQAVLNKRMVMSTLFANKKLNHTFKKPTP